MGIIISFLRESLKRKSPPSLTALPAADEPYTLVNKKDKNDNAKGWVANKICMVQELCSSRSYGESEPSGRLDLPEEEKVPALGEVEIQVDRPNMVPNKSTDETPNFHQKSNQLLRNHERRSQSLTQNTNCDVIKLFSVVDSNLNTVMISREEFGEIPQTADVKNNSIKQLKVSDDVVYGLNTDSSVTPPGLDSNINDEEEVLEDTTKPDTCQDPILNNIIITQLKTSQDENDVDGNNSVICSSEILDVTEDNKNGDPQEENMTKTSYDASTLTEKISPIKGSETRLNVSQTDVEGESTTQLSKESVTEHVSNESQTAESPETDTSFVETKMGKGSEFENASKLNPEEEAKLPEMEFNLKRSRKNSKNSKNRNKTGKNPSKVKESTSTSKNISNMYYKCKVIDEEIPDASEYFRNSIPTGRTKGLQWKSNSCYMDAMLFSMFYSTTIFDPYFETLSFSNSPTDPMAEKVIKILWNNIVKPLRDKKSFVEANTGTDKLRQALSSINPRMLGSMMDVDELISILFKRALKLQGFIQYSIGTGNHMHQIVFNPKNCPSTDNGFIDVQNLLSTSMEFQDLKLASVPVPALIIKMSRSNGSLVYHEGILPNLVLDVSSLMANPEDHGSPKYMYLAAVIVLRGLHYTAFVRHGINTSSDWYYFDSLSATVVNCPNLGDDISSMEQNLENLGNVKFSSQLARIVSDNHVCIYFSPVNDSSNVTKL